MLRIHIFLILLILIFPLWQVVASSDQAYKDYLFQFDIYRQKNTEFKIAKNEYEKFKSLVSQTAALEKSKEYLAARDQLLRAYLLLLNEKLNEDQGLKSTEKNLYQTLISNEVAFLDQHSELLGAVGSLTDADNVSKQLVSHYHVLQGSMRQTIIGISMGNLAILRRDFELVEQNARSFINNNRLTFPAPKQAIFDRWLIQIGNKKSLFDQKFSTISIENAGLKGKSIDELDRLFAKLQKDTIEARQYLVEGTSFIGELLNAMRYIN